jgi:beta-lactamase class A
VLLIAAPPQPASAQTPPTSGFTGDIGVYAVTISPTASEFLPISEVSSNPDQSFPLASSFKPLVLHAALRDVDAGVLGWRDRINIQASDHSLDYGGYGKRSPVKKLANKMIKRSHNTSTDVLFKTVGIGAPTAILDSWGLTNARVVTPTREFWLGLSGLVPSQFDSTDLANDAAAFAADTRAGQIATVEAVRSLGSGFSVDQIDRATNPFYNFNLYNQATTFDILDDIDNVATPREMVEAYWNMFFLNGLSAESDENFRKLMKKGDGRVDRRQINVPLRYWGGKGGSDLGMGSVAGYGETRNGKHIIYAIFGSRMTDEDGDWDIIETNIGWVFDTLDP